MDHPLNVGTAELDITPPIGTMLAGGLLPRPAEGIDDPLTIKTLVIDSAGTKLAYVLLDLCVLPRKEGDKAVRLAAKASGIPESNIFWATSHTHSGPYTEAIFGVPPEEVIDSEWLEMLPGKFADTVARAAKSTRPARLSRASNFCQQVCDNRRIRFKDGSELNRWVLSPNLPCQSLGSAGPIDPELGILCFDGEDAKPIAILWNLALHANTHFGKNFSGDYPAVVAARLREHFGTSATSLYMPGACGNINRAGSNCRGVGDCIAESIIQALRDRRPLEGPLSIDAVKEDISLPYRDFTVDQKERIAASGLGQTDVFFKELEIMRKEGVTETATTIQAWRIGDSAFLHFSGEVFVEYGIEIKEKSPFPWTYPVELSGDYSGYYVTPQAWEAGGYECLIARSSKISVEGVRKCVDRGLDLLRQLWDRAGK